jgi:hypothetical protein
MWLGSVCLRQTGAPPCKWLPAAGHAVAPVVNSARAAHCCGHSWERKPLAHPMAWHDAVALWHLQGEYGLTNVLMSHGYNVATLMARYSPVSRSEQLFRAAQS